MRTYGRLLTQIYEDPAFTEGLTDQGKLGFIYLKTCQHSNLLGCYVVKPLYMSADLNWDIEKTQRTIEELRTSGKIQYDSSTSLVRIVDWFEENKIDNPNVGKSVPTLIGRLPFVREILSPLARDLLRWAEKLPVSYVDALKILAETETRSEPVRNPLPMGIRPQEPEPLPEPLPYQEPEPSPEPLPKPLPMQEAAKIADDPHRDECKQAVEAWNQTSRRIWTNKRPCRLTEQRVHKFVALFGHITPRDWSIMLIKVKNSPYLCGETQPWCATIDWLLNPENADKVLEGNYDEAVLRSSSASIC